MKKILFTLILSMTFHLFTIAQDTIPKPVPPPPAPAPVATPPPPPPPSQHKVEKRINGYAIYTFDDSYSSSYDNYNYYEGKIKGGMQYGVGLEFMVKHYYGVELLWIGQNTNAPTTYLSSSYSGTYKNLDLSLNYAMLGFGRHIQKMDGRVEGYTGLMVGCLFANAKDSESGKSQSGEKFAWGFRLGLNIWATDKLALKLQGQLLSAVQSVGGSLYFGTGGGGAGLSTYSTMLQFGVGGGITYRLGK
jgi:hypothetical protein